MGEGQGCTLCKEGQDLVLQYSIRCEESKVLNNLSDCEFLVGVSCRQPRFPGRDRPEGKDEAPG
jgi:hypothetical protein